MDIIEHEGDTQVAEEELDALIIQAMGAARKQGNIPTSLLEMFDEITKPSIDLHTLLHAYMSESFLIKSLISHVPIAVLSIRNYIYQVTAMTVTV